MNESKFESLINLTREKVGHLKEELVLTSEIIEKNNIIWANTKNVRYKISNNRYIKKNGKKQILIKMLFNK